MLKTSLLAFQVPKLFILNAKHAKKKPHNITIKNFNPNEPKPRKPKILYSEKQNYRRYKTKTEPKLYSKIMIDEEDDIIAKIRKEFGMRKIKKQIIVKLIHPVLIMLKTQNQ